MVVVVVLNIALYDVIAGDIHVRVRQPLGYTLTHVMFTSRDLRRRALQYLFKADI